VRLTVLFTLLSFPLLAADRFTGYQSCASSGCHGGGKGDDQLWIWGKADPHGRADSILSASRSKRIGEALGISDTAISNQCTVCHSPMQSAAPERLMPGIKANRGVSCEACHGPAEKWLRFHTRPDASHAQRVAVGMRDLEKPAQRANACAGCHLHLPAGLKDAGHPELRFELARQLAELPPHWTGDLPLDAPKMWLAGQAVSLRELAWRAQSKQEPGVLARIAAIRWLLSQTDLGKTALPESGSDFVGIRAAANRLATQASGTRAQIEQLCKNAPSFRDASQDAETLRRRAEVLVSSVRALTIPLRREKDAKLEEHLRQLDDQLRSPVSFTASIFAGLLESLPSLLAEG
jgi:hypothetical protein